MNSIYEEIGRRTDGNIYLAVVGPVRTGKSTFAKRFMEQLVIPSIDNVYHRERARDELPQSGSGKTITTSEPKFIPEQAVEMTGHAVGGVCPFANPEGVRTYLDVSMRRFDTVFPAAGSSNSAIQLTCDELAEYSHSQGWVDVCKGWQEE